MKIFALIVLRKTDDGTILLCSEYDLSSFGFFQRRSVQEFMDFTAGIIIKGTEKGTRTSVREQDYVCHGYARADRLSAVAICDEEYPQREAFTMLMKILIDFCEKVPLNTWSNCAITKGISYSSLSDFLRLYQNPREVDLISKVQAELDDTKLIVCDTIEKVLNRGEKLDDLVAKSEGLSQQSKLFYRTAKKTNSCCGGL